MPMEFHNRKNDIIIIYSIVYLRLQRAQEERTRRNTNRYYDESILLTGGEINGNYRNGTTNNPSLSSSSSYSRRGDQPSYISNNSSTVQQHPPTLNYVPHANILAAVNGSTQTHLAYFQSNPVIKQESKCFVYCFFRFKLGFFNIWSCWYSKSTIS